MQVELPGEYGGSRLRDGLTVVLFKRGPFKKWSSELGEAFELWLRSVPEDGKKFALVGASSTATKPVNNRTIGRCRKMLQPEHAAARDLTSFWVQGPERVNPEFRCEVHGVSKPKKTEANYLAMRFPSAWAEDGGDALADFVLELADKVTFDSGYAGAALLPSVDAEMGDIRKDAPGLAFRHPGFDLQDFGMAVYDLGEDIWGAQWMTLLGPGVLQRVGGKHAIVSAVPDFSVQETPNGVLIRSPLPPRGGDANRGDGIDELRPLAEFLEPVTTSSDRNSFFWERSDAERWFRRFID